ncbi:MAG: hypothetical protein J5790_06315 [Bacteroidaceae bacterium]|nr:hypothetical protein [Bacteroidaceae bacterium]
MYARILILFFVMLLAFTSCQERKADFFERDAREYTEKNCPQMLDEYTTLDSVVYVKEKDGAGDLVQYYSLNLNEAARQELMNQLGELAEMNLTAVRNSIVFAKHKEEGVSFTYIYHDATTGEKIVEYHFTKKDYQ